MITLPSWALMKKGPNVIMILIGAVLALSFLDTCHAANNTTNKEAQSMEKGMRFLFQMTTGFLELIQPNRLYDEYSINKLVNDKAYQEESLRNWQKATLYLIGYAVCAAIGIVFIIVMPIIGCCLCCCRTCCKKCGGKQHKHDPKNARYKRGCYVTFLTMFNTFILFAVVCTFVTNELYKKRFIDDAEIFNVARRGTKNLITYVDKSFADLKNVAKKQVGVLETDLLAQLNNAGNKTVTALSKNLNVTQVLDEVDALGKGIIKLNSTLADLSQTLDALIKTGVKLEDELDAVKKKVTNKLSQCGKAQNDCNSIWKYINETSVNANFSQLDTQAALLNNLTDYLNIPNLAQQAQERFNKVSEDISKVVNEQNATIAKSFKDVSSKMDTSLDFSEVKNSIPSKEIDEQLNKALDLYNSNKTSSSIPWYVGLCVGSILLLIVVCNYLGILFGLCGERAGENTPCCNRGVAANFLLAGVGFYFIFCWILIILVLIEFLVGGIIYTELCRYLNPNDPQQLKPILLNFNYSYRALDQDLNLYSYDFVDKCHKNATILNALSFPQRILDDKIPKEQIKAEIEKIDPNKIKIGKVELLSADLKKKLDGLEGLNTQINLTQYEIQLNKTIVTNNLGVIAKNLTSLSNLVNKDFNQEAQELIKIQDTTYNKMKNEMKDLSNILIEVKKNMDLKANVKSLVDTILAVQTKVQDDGKNIIIQIVKDETINLIKIVDTHLTNLVKTIINEVAPCRPLYDIVFTFTDIVCVTFLNPMNGFWFSTGWAVFFFLPTIIFATKLAGLYRCWYKRDPNQENTDSFAAGDADHIPLARVNQGKSSPQGMPNSAYDELPSNKYQPPPNHHPYNYGGPGHHYNSGYPVYPPPSYHDTRMNPARY